MHRALHVGYRHVAHAPTHLHVTGNLLDFHRAFFLTDLDVGRDIVDRSVTVLRGKIDVAASPADVYITTSGADSHRRFPRDGNIKVGFHWMISRSLHICIEGDQPADRGDGRLGFGVVLVGVTLIFRANSLADDYGDFVVIRCVHADRAMIVDDFQAGVSRKILLEMVVVIESLTEYVGEISVVNIDLVAQPGPVHAL